jgi:hypothetical protein
MVGEHLMRTLRLSLSGTIIVALLSGLGGAAVAQDETGASEATRETRLELTIPAAALPTDFVSLVVENWTLAPGTDTTTGSSGVLGNEALRGRGLVVESGGLLVTPATEALLWRDLTGEPEMTPAGEALTLAVGEAIFLPAIPDAEVDAEASVGIANPGSEEATAWSFHTHQAGGTFSGYPSGLTLGPWDISAAFDPEAVAAFDGVDAVFRLSRIEGGPGASITLMDPPAFNVYYVESGELTLLTQGPGGEFTSKWSQGWDGPLPWPPEELEQSLAVTSDGPAKVHELAIIPQPLP